MDNRSNNMSYSEEMIRQLASMVKTQFEKLNRKVDTLQQTTTNISARLDSMEAAAAATNIGQSINTSAGPQNPPRTTESPSTLESEPHEEKPNVIHAAATTPAAPATTAIPTPVAAEPTAPMASAPKAAAPVQPAPQMASPPVAQTAAPQGIARTTTAEPNSSPEQPAEPVAAQNPAPVGRCNGSSDAGAARIPQVPQPATASTVQTVVPPPQTLAQALQNVEESRASPAPSGAAAMATETDLRQIVANMPKKRMRANHEHVYVYDIAFALYVKAFGIDEEPLHYLPHANAKVASAMFDGNMNAIMGIVQYKLKNMINLIQTMAEYQEFDHKKPNLIQRNLRLNLEKRLDRLVELQMAETAQLAENANNYAQRHPETPANAVLSEPSKRTVPNEGSVGSGATASGASGAAGSDADGDKTYEPNEEDDEFIEYILTNYLDPNLPENKKAQKEMAARIARVKAEPEDDYERPVVLPPSSSNAVSTAKTTVAPALAAAAAGAKKKITPGEQEMLARTLSATQTQAAREAAPPIVNATPASYTTVNQPPFAVPHGTRAGTVNPTSHIASAAIRTDQLVSNGPIRIERQQNAGVGRQAPQPGLVNPTQAYPGGPIIVRPSMLPNLAPINYTITGYPNGAHPRARQTTSQNYAPQPSYAMPSGGQFQQLPIKRSYDMGQQQQPISGQPATKYQRY